MYLSLPASLRLLFVASIIDVLYSCFRIYNLSIMMPGFSGDYQAHCKASMAGMTFFNLMSVFVRALLSVHLQLVILSNVQRVMAYERHFLAVACGISVVLAVVPVITGNYVWLDFDPTLGSGHCGYFKFNLGKAGTDWNETVARKAVQQGLAIMWATNFAWLTLTVFYGIFVIVSVVIRLVHQRNMLDRVALNRSIVVMRPHGRREFWSMAAKVVRRILQFPLMVVVCHVLEVVYGMAMLSTALKLMNDGILSNDNPDKNLSLTKLYLAAQIMLGMEGIITLFFLPLEPPIRLMLRSEYLRRKKTVHQGIGKCRNTYRNATMRRKPVPCPACDADDTKSALTQTLPPPPPVSLAPSVSSQIPLTNMPHVGSPTPTLRPVRRAPTIDSLQWDVVFMADSHDPEDDVASNILALRNDGLPAQQWFVPARANTEEVLAHAHSSRTLLSEDRDA
ncbi:hypothetical protein FBU59_000055 [Linderina macrospora]|uniref:Uncharacterized protein n=1 Tax=Linderina macrospora TaxID=4868 RepID=A0ACC1JHU8_9FUNG|nr:hypothetical protein FBU59_000055 [Linderina macrospora]